MKVSKFIFSPSASTIWIRQVKGRKLFMRLCLKALLEVFREKSSRIGPYRRSPNFWKLELSLYLAGQ